jgi:phospholipase C
VPTIFRGNIFGGGFNADGTTSPFNGSYCNICNPFEYEASYPGMVADHMRDVTDLFTDLANGTLPAVSYVKPDGLVDGHPASSKWSLFEAFAQNIIDLAQSNPEQWAETAIFVTVDEAAATMTPASSSRLISSEQVHAFP